MYLEICRKFFNSKHSFKKDSSNKIIYNQKAKYKEYLLIIDDNFAYFFIKTYVVGNHKNCLTNEHKHGDSNKHPQHRFV